MGNSYQKLKQSKRYGEQRQDELLQILKDVDAQLRKSKTVIHVPMRMQNLSGDKFLTDINMGEAEFGLTNIIGNFK